MKNKSEEGIVDNFITSKVYNFVYMITTFNRLSFLKKTIETWNATRNKRHNWTLIVADDGSNDGTLDYLYSLALENIKLFIIENKSRGVHHQTNSLIKFALNLEFDFGFKSDDDLLFLKPGWDIKYLKAAKTTGLYHLVYYDKDWGARHKEVKPPVFKENILENYISSTRLQGALWTFNKKVLSKVGFFDTQAFNVCGYGHVDYSLRCCRLGYNDIANPFDVKNSNNYIKLNQENYVSNNGNNTNIWNTPKIVTEKKEILLQDRGYIPYNRLDVQTNGKKIKLYDISFIIPIRDRDSMKEGLERNIQEIFGGFSYEIIYVQQNDERLFRRGQLCNIGFRESLGDIIIFQDADIRHLRSMDPRALLRKFKKPFVAFDKITQLNEKEIGSYELLGTESRLFGWGACAVFYREQFMLSGGFSNLVFGWGAEDNIMHARTNFQRLEQDLGHVYHEPLRFSKKVHESVWYKNNRFVLETDKNRDKYKDGYIQTRYNATRDSNCSYIHTINVESISVATDFKYKTLYEQMRGADNADSN